MPAVVARTTADRTWADDGGEGSVATFCCSDTMGHWPERAGLGTPQADIFKETGEFMGQEADIARAGVAKASISRTAVAAAR